MSNDLNTSININVGGNFTRRLTDNARSMQRFSSNGQRQMARLRRSSLAVAKGLDRMGNRYTGLITGAAGLGTAKFLVSLERRFTRLGIQADIGAEQVDALKRKIFEVAQAPNIRIDPSELTAAVEQIIEKTGDLKFAEDNLNNLAVAISATGAMGNDIGGLAAEFQKMDVKEPKKVAEALDILTVQGKSGAFTLENLATLGSRVVTAYTAMGRTGVPALREMGAALQVIRQGTGTSEMAATAFEALLRTLSDPQKVKMLQKGGIKVFDEDALKEGREVLRPINELMEEIVILVQGKKTVLGGVFDAEAVRAFNTVVSEFNRDGEVTSIDKFYKVHADGSTILADSTRASKDSAAAMQSLYTAWQKFADANLTKHIQSLAESLDNIDPETIDKLIKGAATALAVGGTAIIASKAIRGGMAVSRLFGKNKAGAIGGALGAATATPVFVVNMPGGGMPGGVAGIPGKAGKFKPAAKLGRFQSARAMSRLGLIAKLGVGTAAVAGGAVAGAGALGYGAGTLAYNNLDDDKADRIGEAIVKALALFGNDEAQAALATREATGTTARNDLQQAFERQQANAKLEIEVTDKRVQVKSINSNDMDINVDTGLVMP